MTDERLVSSGSSVEILTPAEETGPDGVSALTQEAAELPTHYPLHVRTQLEGGGCPLHRCLRCANVHTSEGLSGHSWGEVGWREGPWGVCAGEGLVSEGLYLPGTLSSLAGI